MDRSFYRCSDTRSWWIFVAGVVVAFLPVMIFRDFTPSNELRYLSIVDEALSDGSFFTFHNHGAVYADKPPLYFWVIMLCRVVAGRHCMWLLSLFSLIPALVVLRVMDLWTAARMAPAWRGAARLMLITCGLFAGLAFTLRQDMLMVMFIVLALRCFYRMYEKFDKDSSESTRHGQWMFGVLVFMALFSKGPLGVLVPVVSILVFLAFRRRLAFVGRFLGWRFWLALASLTFVWFWLAAREGGWEYVHNLCFHQTMDRAVAAFTHKRPFWYYAVSIWYCALPWSLTAIGVVIAAWIGRRLGSSMESLFGITVLTTLVMLSCISGKLQVYMLPVFPFLIYLAALNLPAYGDSRWCRVSLGVVAFTLVCVVPAAHILPGLLPEVGWMLESGWIYAAAYALAVAALVSLVMLFSHRHVMSLAVRILAIGVLVALFCVGWALPALNPGIGYSALCDEALKKGESLSSPVYYVFDMYRPENMDALLHAPVVEVDSLSQIASASWQDAVVLAPSADRKAFSGRNIQQIGPYLIVTE